MLEASCHKATMFATLTYSPEFLPEGGSVVPGHLQAFLKRLRKLVPYRLRFYGVGEYGDRTFRPHYHVCLFGLADPRPVSSAWRLGGVHVVPVSSELLRYVCGYVVKKMTASDDVRLGGRHPEFCRMSLRPGIGAFAAVEIARHVNTEVGAREVARSGDVPRQIRWERKKWPLGRYLRGRIRDEAGYSMDSYDKTRRARHESLDASSWMKAFEESLGREGKREQSVYRARFLTTLRKGKL